MSIFQVTACREHFLPLGANSSQREGGRERGRESFNIQK